MDSFIVSARKYRPATFNTVVGQISITGTLKNAIRNNQLAQAFLFCGPRGVGKTTCARILAKTINCTSPTADIEPCNECTSCIAFNDSASFNIHELDAASNNSVDDIRNLVDQVRIPPQMGRYRVYIIDEVHMLSSQAFNAFLKTLEEPPSYAKFILATTEKHKIIPTILSRCQIFDFKRITIDDIAKHLRFVADSEQVTADTEALHIIAHKADGALRDALSIFDQLVTLGNKTITRELVIENLNVLDYDYYFRIMDFIKNGNYKDTLLIVNEVIGKGFDGQHFITGMGEHLRNLLMSLDTETVKLIETSDAVRAKYIEQSGSIPIQLLVNALDVINKTDVTYRTSNNKRLSLEVPLIQICMLSGNMVIPENTTQPISIQPVKKAQPPLNSSIKTEPQPQPQPEIPVTPVPDTMPSISEDKVTYVIEPEVKEVKDIPEIESVPLKPEAGLTDAEPAHDVPVQSHHMSSVSIKGLSSLTQDVKKEGIQPEVKRNEVFTVEMAEQAINRFAEECKDDSALYYAALTTYKPEVRSENEIVITVGNRVLEKEFNDRRNVLLMFLKNELNNDFISFKVIVNEQPTEARKYLSDREKLDIMTKDNPNVAKLRSQLDLGLEI